MATLKLVDTKGADKGTVEGADKIFDAPAQPELVHEVVVALQNAKRHGTHKVKTRAEVSGTGAKPYRQKGTGRARHGSNREPQMRGGGTVHGPQPRSYRQAVPVRAKRQALCSVLSERARGERLCVLSGLQVEAPKTKPFAEMVDLVSPDGRKVLVITADQDRNVLLSARNIPRVTVRTAADVNALDVIGAMRVVLQQEALETLEARLS